MDGVSRPEEGRPSPEMGNSGPSGGGSRTLTPSPDAKWLVCAPPRPVDGGSRVTWGRAISLCRAGSEPSVRTFFGYHSYMSTARTHKLASQPATTAAE